MVQWGDRYRYFFLKDAALRRLRFKFFIAKVKRSCRERNSSISKGNALAQHDGAAPSECALRLLLVRSE